MHQAAIEDAIRSRLMRAVGGGQHGRLPVRARRQRTPGQRRQHGRAVPVAVAAVHQGMQQTRTVALAGIAFVGAVMAMRCGVVQVRLVVRQRMHIAQCAGDRCDQYAHDQHQQRHQAQQGRQSTGAAEQHGRSV